LKSAGLRLATLTNSAPVMIDAQLKHAGLADMFDAVLSVEQVHRFKPAREVYDMAASELASRPADLWLVAAHNWDTTGAMRAGWNAAFVARPGMVLGPLDARPKIVGKDLAEVAERLLVAAK
jgi:2-haloacid dehalogenase